MYFEIAETDIRIMGSLHAFPVNGKGMPSWALDAFEWCDQLIFESSPQEALSQLRPPVGRPLRDELTSNAWASLQEYWPTSGVLPPLEKVQPWAALVFGSMLMCQVSEGVEGQFLRLASEKSKDVKFLETAEEFTAALDAAPLNEVIESIELLAADLSEPQRLLETMYGAWLKQDLLSLFDAATKSPAFRFVGVRNAALQRRNRAWALSLQPHFKSTKRTLVVVGALHLCGPENLLSLINREAKPIQNGLS